jgi:glucose-1-phosphate cytidylyltransferase
VGKTLMKVVILCGGKGTRIRDVNETLPKPMVPVGNYPILWHVMKSYADYGYKEFILCLGYKAEVIKDFFLNYRSLTSNFTIDFNDQNKITYHAEKQPLDWKITFVNTGMGSLTGSRVSKIRSFVGDDENFMLTYADGLGDVDIPALETFHCDHNKIMTVCGVHPPGRFGELEKNADGQVTEFNEKPQASGGRISGGFFVCKKTVFNYLDVTRDDETLEAGPMRNIARDNEMMMYTHDGFWQCMDTRRDFELLNQLHADGNAHWINDDII